MKSLAWFSKIEPRSENISDKFKMEITDKKQFRHFFCIKISLLTVCSSTWAMFGVYTLLSGFHPEAYSKYGMTIGIFTIVLAKIVPHALFPYNKDSKYPCTVFYAFGVAQLIMVGVLYLLLNKLDSLLSFWRGDLFLGHNKSQVFTALLSRWIFISQFALAIWLETRIKLPNRNDYILKKKSWEIQKCLPESLIIFLIFTFLLLFLFTELIYFLNHKLLFNL